MPTRKQVITAFAVDEGGGYEKATCPFCNHVVRGRYATANASWPTGLQASEDVCEHFARFAFVQDWSIAVAAIFWD